MKRLAFAALLLLAACGSGDSDKLPDDLTSAEGVEQPDLAIENEPEPEPEPQPRTDEPFADVAPATPAPELEAPADPLAPEPAPRPALPRPSFDCDAALNRVEAMICGDPELARLDRRLARDHDRALGQASPGERQRLATLGRRYLADRNRCSTRDCVLQAYRWYLRDIDSVMGWQGQ